MSSVMKIPKPNGCSRYCNPQRTKRRFDPLRVVYSGRSSMIHPPYSLLGASAPVRYGARSGFHKKLVAIRCPRYRDGCLSHPF